MDLMQREGKYPLPAQASKTIMGVEFAGTVTKVGEGAKQYKEGDEVFGLAFGVSRHHTPTQALGLTRLLGCICGIHCFARVDAAAQAERAQLGPSSRYTRELDDR
jgi:NADPH:quinone reductase-like Zn-dependent oxidoreductase